MADRAPLRWSLSAAWGRLSVDVEWNMPPEPHDPPELPTPTDTPMVASAGNPDPVGFRLPPAA